MPITAELRRENGEVVRDLPDPAGGTFDAAGDFDALLPQAAELRTPPPDAYTLLRYVDPYGDTIFNRAQMPDLLADIDVASALELTSIQRRGLDRLRVMAERCGSSTHLSLWFIGD
jgi:hypothetical protein